MMSCMLPLTSSFFGILYGSPKVHKGPSVPLRPILAAYNLPNYKLAKCALFYSKAQNISFPPKCVHQ